MLAHLKSVQVAFCHFQKAEQAASLEVKKREEGGGEMEVVQKRKREKKEKVHISSSSSTFFLSCSPTCSAAKSKAVGENCFLLKEKNRIQSVQRAQTRKLENNYNVKAKGPSTISTMILTSEGEEQWDEVVGHNIQCPHGHNVQFSLPSSPSRPSPT